MSNRAVSAVRLNGPAGIAGNGGQVGIAQLGRASAPCLRALLGRKLHGR